jgi:hypothetical protein
MKKRKKKKMSVSILVNSNLYNFEKISKPDLYDNGFNSCQICFPVFERFSFKVGEKAKMTKNSFAHSILD